MSFIAADLDDHIRSTLRIADSLRHRLLWAHLLKSSLSSHNHHHHLPFRPAAEHALRAIESPCRLIFDYPPTPTPRPKAPSISFLYIKSDALGYPGHDLYLIRCPKCLRSAFTTLQGLLNHARIAHRLEWGTHEDCVRECAVLQPGLDTAAGVEVGIGPCRILPSIRTIFRMAVTNQSEASTILGLHEDTPTLAPFLGKNPIRRGIKVYKQDDPVDVVTPDRDAKLRHCTPRLSRNVASRDADHFNYTLQPSHHQTVEIRQPDTPAGASRSRFYFTTRIIVTDRSLWTPPRVSPSGISLPSMEHLSMLAIVHDLTTILKNVTVVPAETIPSSVYIHSSADSPPYVVVGTSDRPFLARVELLFNGTGRSEPDSQKIILEHWVELDRVKSAAPATGEEQIIDIELDKRTIIGPSRLNHTAVDSKPIWDLLLPTTKQLGATLGEEPNYSQVLTRLMPAFPMIKESKHAVSVPYKLAQTKAHLQSMNMGRRKASEWGRAKALRGAYLEEISGRDDRSGFPILSDGDVYVWLSSKGYSHRPWATQTHAEEDSSRSCSYCHLCGLDQGICKRSEGDDLLESHDMTEFPLVDLRHIPTPVAPPTATIIVPHFVIPDLLSISNPTLVGFVKDTVELLALSKFSETEDNHHPFGDRTLASYALLSLVMTSFIRSLVVGGLDMSRQDMDSALKEAKKKRQYMLTKRMLTPSHIIRAIMAQGNEPLFSCLAKLDGQ